MQEKDKLFKKFMPEKTMVVKARCNEARNKYFYYIQQKQRAFYASLLDK